MIMYPQGSRKKVQGLFHFQENEKRERAAKRLENSDDDDDCEWEKETASRLQVSSFKKNGGSDNVKFNLMNSGTKKP